MSAVWKRRFQASKWLEPVIRELRKGPCTKAELEKRAKLGGKQIPHSQLYRVIYSLKDLDLITEREGKVWWHTHYKEYEDRTHYEIDLRHSKALIKKWGKFKWTVDQEDDSIIRRGPPWRLNGLIEHLKTGYPDLHALYIRTARAWAKLGRAESAFLERGSKKGPNRRARGEVEKLRERSEELWRKFAEGMGRLESMVEYGTPLRGECGACKRWVVFKPREEQGKEGSKNVGF